MRLAHAQCVHRAAGRHQLLGQAPTRLHHTQRVSQGYRPGYTDCTDLAETVSEQRIGSDPPMHPQPRQGIFDREYRRLGIAGLLQVAVTGRTRVQHQGQQVHVHQRLQQGAAFIDLRLEEWFAVIQCLGHCPVLAALPRKEHHQRRRRSLAAPFEYMPHDLA